MTTEQSGIKAEHTPEPWSICAAQAPTDGELDYAILDPAQEIIAEAFGRTSETNRPDARANAHRIVACVNACQGIPDPKTTIPELISALRNAVDVLVSLHASVTETELAQGWDDDEALGAYIDARAALAKLEGAQQR